MESRCTTFSEIKKSRYIQGWTNKASCLSISNHIRCWDFEITADKILFYKCFIWSAKLYARCLHMCVQVYLRDKLNYTAFLAHKNQWKSFGSIANRICCSLYCFCFNIQMRGWCLSVIPQMYLVVCRKNCTSWYTVWSLRAQ